MFFLHRDVAGFCYETFGVLVKAINPRVLLIEGGVNHTLSVDKRK